MSEDQWIIGPAELTRLASAELSEELSQLERDSHAEVLAAMDGRRAGGPSIPERGAVVATDRLRGLGAQRVLCRARVRESSRCRRCRLRAVGAAEGRGEGMPAYALEGRRMGDMRRRGGRGSIQQRGGGGTWRWH